MITGLGNNERQYDHTLHNVGFQYLDSLAANQQLTWKKHNAATGDYCVWQHPLGRIILFKPGRLMNINGGPIIHCLRYHKIPLDQMVVAYDDLSFPIGTVKLKEKGGHAGHNGMRDILDHSQDDSFYRLRFGIGRPPSTHNVSAYVLSRPSEENTKILHKTVAHAIENIDNMILGNLSKFQEAMLKSPDN
tara:strand:- start:2020 stop:2589 length:570 start_codon:yes stop_codon:yes gene_type:complete